LMFTSWFWLARGWDTGLFFTFLLGLAIAFAQEILDHCVFIYKNEKLKIDKRK